MSSALETLSDALCPWLFPAYERFEAARATGQLGHAWLIGGPRGVGKINLALALAARLLGAEARPQPLAPRAALDALANRHAPVDRHPDLHWLHPEEDKETISVEQVRGVIEELALTAHRSGAKVVIIEPAEALTTAAANALLKTLEEPTANSYLLLVSHSPGRLPATVRSRCQRFGVRGPRREVLAEWLALPLDAVAEAVGVAGDSPLEVAEAALDKTIDIKALERSLADVCEDRADGQALAQTWAKDGPQKPLEWLRRHLHEELRQRAGRADSTGVTVPVRSALHNAWRALPSRTLVEQYDRAEKLVNQLGSGVNVELSLQALLSAFHTNRGGS